MSLTNMICSYLRQEGVAFYSSSYDSVHADEELLSNLQDSDCVLVLGGDGSMLRAAGLVRGRNIPLLGINLGTLGYMAETEAGEWMEAVNRLRQGQYTIEERMMLEGEIMPGEHIPTDAQDMPSREDVSGYGGPVSVLNDVVLRYTGDSNILDFRIFVNGKLLTGFKADGMIVSTPTGSTGYSLSAGGPIIEPVARTILLTPICAHTLAVRSVVLSQEDEVVLEWKRGSSADIMFDGVSMGPVESSRRLRVKKSDYVTKIIKLEEQSFMEIVRRKMG